MSEPITLINPNLGVLCHEAQELILKGYRFKDGYPQMYAWQYHAVLEMPERVLERPKIVSNTEAPKQVGRPKSSK